MAALLMKEESKYVMLVSGVLCVMTFGMEMMLQWPVGSWDSLHGVRDLYFVLCPLYLYCRFAGYACINTLINFVQLLHLFFVLAMGRELILSGWIIFVVMEDRIV